MTADHANLVAAIKAQIIQAGLGRSEFAHDDPLVLVLRHAADALADTVPREQYNEATAARDMYHRWHSRVSAERDALAAREAQVRGMHTLGSWHEPWNGSNGRNPDGYWHEGCMYCESYGKCDTLVLLDAAPSVSLAQHDAEVWRQAAAFVDEQREDFDGDLRQVRDRMRDHADWVAANHEEAGL